MLFFTLPNSQNAAVVSGGGFFSWGTKFKYTGRTEREILTESINALRQQKLSNSLTSKRKASSVPATPSSPPGDFGQIRYSSLPRSTMSEPLTYCNTAATECLNNIVLYQSREYDDTDIAVVQLPSLEPVSEDARLCTSTKLNNLNNVDSGNVNVEESNYYMRSEDTIVYSPPMSGKFDSVPLTLKKPTGQMFSAFSQHNQHKHKLSGNTAYDSSKVNSSESVIHQNSANSAKVMRKFRFMNVFIPSVLFVVILMTVSAIFVIESESNVFEQIRNLPEMISLRYQYYQPLKKFILKKVGLKT